MGLTNSGYEAVMREYDSIRYKNAEILQRRTAEVYKRVPAIKDIDDEITELFGKLAKTSLYLSDDAFKSAKAEAERTSKEMKDRRTRLLVENGFENDYLEMPYDCAVCRDTGFIQGSKCSCFKTISTAVAFADKTYMMAKPDITFKDFREDFYASSGQDEETGLSPRDCALKAFSHLKNFADGFEKSPKNFLLFGGAGVGKTFLVSALANEVAKKGCSVVFLTAHRFFELLENHSFHRESLEETGEYRSIEPVFRCDLLVLDDIGTEVVNAFTSSKLFECINERILTDKSTVISTNLNLSLIKSNYSERVFSRIAGHYSVFKLTGNDGRIHSKGFTAARR